MENKYLNKIIEFEKMEKNHKENFFEIKKEFSQKKIELLKKHHSQITDLYIKELEDKIENVTPEVTKKHILEKLDLHEKQLQEFSDLCKQKGNKFKQWLENNKKEREDFRKNL